MQLLGCANLFAFIFFVGFNANAQPEQIKNLDSLAGQFIKYIRSKNSEKIFVITDKEFYVAGEKIWAPSGRQ